MKHDAIRLTICGVFLVLAACALRPTPTLPAPLSANAPAWKTTTIASPAEYTRSTELPAGDSCGRSPPSGCTVFTVSKGDRVFFGGNDDYVNPDSCYWVDPGGA